MLLEININHLIKDADRMIELSGSVMEHGNRAAAITWENSKKRSKREPLLKTPKEIAHAKNFLKEFGIWDRGEIETVTDEEIQALTLQYIAGDIREIHGMEWEEIEKAQADGRISSGIFKAASGDWFYSLNH